MTKKRKNREKKPAQEIIKKNKTFSFLGNKTFFFICMFYLFVTLVLFSGVITKPLNSPDSISQAYPIYQFNKTHILKNGSLPFWFPYMNGGFPYLEGSHANLLMDSLVYLFPVELGIGYRAILFVFLCGLFAYFGFRSFHLSVGVSFVAGLAYLLSCDAVTYTALGHYGKVVNMAFLPLAFFFLNRAFEKRKYAYFLFAGFALGYMYRGHPQVFYYNLLVVSAYVLFRAVQTALTTKKWDILLFVFLGYGLAGISAICVAFDNLYHQLKFVEMTSRGSASDYLTKWMFSTSWSLHPLEMLNYFIPSLFGLSHEYYYAQMGWRPLVSTSDYAGLIVIFTAFYGLMAKNRKQPVRFFVFSGLILVLFGFGKYFPGFFRFFFEFVPMMKSFRVPSSIYITVSFFLVFLSAVGIESLFQDDEQKKPEKRSTYLFLLLIIVLLIFMSGFITKKHFGKMLQSKIEYQQLENIRLNAGMEYVRSQPDAGYRALRRVMKEAEKTATYQMSQLRVRINQYIRGMESNPMSPLNQTLQMSKKELGKFWLYGLILMGLVLLSFYGKISRRNALTLLVFLLLFDLIPVNKKFIKPVSDYDVVAKPTDVVRFLSQDKSRFRILPYPVANDTEANKWCNFNIESASGYNPITMSIYDDMVNRGMLNRPDFQGLFNVKYLVARNPLNDPAYKLVYRGSKEVYSNRFFKPREFFVDQYTVLSNKETRLMYMSGSPDYRPGENIILNQSPDIEDPKPGTSGQNRIISESYTDDETRLEIDVKQAGFLFFSEVYYPKWECTIDGETVKIYNADHLFRAVYVTEGTHTVLMKYKNTGFYLFSLLFSSLFTFALLYLMFLFWKKKRVLF